MLKGLATLLSNTLNTKSFDCSKHWIGTTALGVCRLCVVYDGGQPEGIYERNQTRNHYKTEWVVSRSATGSIFAVHAQEMAPYCSEFVNMIIFGGSLVASRGRCHLRPLDSNRNLFELAQVQLQINILKGDQNVVAQQSRETAKYASLLRQLFRDDYPIAKLFLPVMYVVLCPGDWMTWVQSCLTFNQSYLARNRQ